MTDLTASVTGVVPDGLRLLLVDDDAVDRARVRRLLPPVHEVCEAATGAEARQCFGNGADMVLLDYRLPDVDGADLLAWFVAQGVPVVMLTGVEDAEAIVGAMQHGADDYLVKDRIERAALERAIRRTAETAALRRAVAEQQAQLADQAAALETKSAAVRELAFALTLAEQSERSRVASLLHDDVQQLLFGAKLLVQSLLTAPVTALATVLPERARSAQAAIDLCIAATRKLTLDLTPPVLDEEDYSVALRWLASHTAESYGLAVDIAAEAPVVIGSREIRVLLTEMVRELLFNAVKHAGVERVRVRLHACDGQAVVEVEDGGRGFDAAAVAPRQGFGLYSIRGRIELVGGQFEIVAAPGAGTRVRLSVPLAAPGATA